jgi:hypothetical protein
LFGLRTIREKAKVREKKWKEKRTGGGSVSVLYSAVAGELETRSVGAMLRLDDLPRRGGDGKSDEFPIMSPTWWRPGQARS